MVAIKYVGPGRYGTQNPGRIWASDEVMDVSPEAATELLKDPYFVKVAKPAPSTVISPGILGEIKPSKKRKKVA